MTVAASAAPGGATGAEDDKPSRLAKRVRKDIAFVKIFEYENDGGSIF